MIGRGTLARGREAQQSTLVSQTQLDEKEAVYLSTKR